MTERLVDNVDAPPQTVLCELLHRRRLALDPLSSCIRNVSTNVRSIDPSPVVRLRIFVVDHSGKTQPAEREIDCANMYVEFIQSVLSAYS